MAKYTRGKLLAGAAPLALAPLAATRLGHEHTAAAGERLATHEGHEHARMGHAAMIGPTAPAVGRPERPRRAALSAGGAPAPAGTRPRVHARREGPGDRGRSRRLLPGVDVQRHGARPRHPRDRGRHPARPLPERRLAPAHDPLPRHPPDQHGRRVRGRRARAASSPTSSRRGRPGCTSTTATRRR